MKKLTRVSSLLIILALVLGACADTNANDNGMDDGFATQESLTNEPGTRLATPVGEATTATGAVETVAPTADSGALATPAATAVMTDTTGIVAEDDPYRASNLLDFTVKNYQGEVIGEVNDVVIDLEGEQLTYLIIEFGGFLGLGETQVAVPYNQVTLGGSMDASSESKSGSDDNDNANTNTNDSNATGGFDDERAFYIDISEEQLENVPEFDRDAIDFTLADWDVDIDAFWTGIESGMVDLKTNGTMTDTTNTNGDDAYDDDDANDNDDYDDDANDNDDYDDDANDNDDYDDDANDNDAGDDDTDANTNDNAGLPAGTNPYAVLLTVLLDSNIVEGAMTGTDSDTGDDTNYNANENTNTNDTAATSDDDYTTIGEVEELIVEPQAGWVMYVVIEAGGTLNIGDAWIPVPINALTVISGEDNDLFENEYTIRIDRELLVNAPNFERGLLPAFDVTDWDAGLRDYWETQ